jgi:hypothetical protein
MARNIARVYTWCRVEPDLDWLFDVLHIGPHARNKHGQLTVKANALYNAWYKLDYDAEWIKQRVKAPTLAQLRAAVKQHIVAGSR